MPAPSKYPDWATDGANTVEPPAGKVAAGWLPAEQPPAGWFNWWQALVGAWTRWLDGRVGTLETDMDAVDVTLTHVARTDQANSFAHPQSIDSATTETNPILQLNGWRADVPLISSNKTPGEHPGVPANLWKLEAQLKRGGGAYVYVYVGANPVTQGAFAVVVNAHWDIATQKWVQDNPAADSTALLVTNAAVVAAARNVGSAPWTTWDKGAALANNFVSDNDFVAGVDFRYATTRSRTVSINPAAGTGTGAHINEGEYAQLDQGQYRLYSIAAPHGATMKAMSVKVLSNGTGCAYTMKLKRRHSVNFGSNALALYQEIDSAPGTLTTGALVANVNDLEWKVPAAALPGETEGQDIIAEALHGYTLYVMNNPGSLNPLFIDAIQFTYVETQLRSYGPR